MIELKSGLSGFVGWVVIHLLFNVGADIPHHTTRHCNDRPNEVISTILHFLAFLVKAGQWAFAVCVHFTVFPSLARVANCSVAHIRSISPPTPSAVFISFVAIFDEICAVGRRGRRLRG
jgi:hypothetical protein